VISELTLRFFTYLIIILKNISAKNMGINSTSQLIPGAESSSFLAISLTC
jgi:hypothetical protein